MPNYMRGNFPFYQPANPYGWQGGYEYDKSPLGRFYLDEVAPEAGYTRWLAEHGYGDFGTPSNALRGLYGRAAAGYGAALGTQPDLAWTDYLGTLEDPQTMLLRMTPFQRGEGRGAGRMRWAQRS